MTVAIVGAGLQGCCAALELAELRHDVVLFDRAATPMQGASLWNEGKIHLGYVYAKDPSLKTACTMLRGALSYRRILERYLQQPLPQDCLSSSFVYGIHCGSLLAPEQLATHYAGVDQLLAEALSEADNDYLGEKRLPPCKAVPTDGLLEPELVSAAFITPERAIDPHRVAELIRRRVQVEPRIRFAGCVDVGGVSRDSRAGFTVHERNGQNHTGFRQLINAAWESRLGLDAGLGYSPDRPWLHRYKLAVHVRLANSLLEIPSVTFVLGEYGDVVSFSDGRLYLSWYPACRVAASSALWPESPEQNLTTADRDTVCRITLEELAKLTPSLRHVKPDPARMDVRGGHIFAWGESDISDPRSRLHQRHEIGVFSDRGYHSINTGKYGMAPWHAVQVADRVEAGA